jgi:hypothetical protein
LIKDNKFEPDNLKIEKGSIVEWRVSSCSKEEISTQRHVVAFDSAPLAMTESNLLK